ncbi:hypothetical protein QBC45DRAFT_403030 [Copromyces sp. CBS 386.78]|nr:hypothetical protein QBC45DRAFT_403030 [Copromyces sp. CBS 386.78]
MEGGFHFIFDFHALSAGWLVLSPTVHAGAWVPFFGSIQGAGAIAGDLGPSSIIVPILPSGFSLASRFACIFGTLSARCLLLRLLFVSVPSANRYVLFVVAPWQ